MLRVRSTRRATPRSARTRAALAACLALPLALPVALATVVALPTPAGAAPTVMAFTTPGCNPWTVPAGVTAVHLSATGSAGFRGQLDNIGTTGGAGDEVTGDRTVVPGQVLTVCVDTGGGVAFAPAGNGGGASGVSLGGDFSQPLLVAGGGGGGGGGQGGTTDCPAGSGAGGNVGQSGSPCNAIGGGAGASGAVPGVGGTAPGGSAGTDGTPTIGDVGPGWGGTGGGQGIIVVFGKALAAGGGGGAGYAGGGGGAALIGATEDGAGGGGGSDFCATSLTNCATSVGAGTGTTPGTTFGDPNVLISYTAGTAPGAPVPPQQTAGYWLGAADGGVFAFGDAQFHGSMAGQPLDAPVVGIASTWGRIVAGVRPNNAGAADGYDLVARDGGVFSFGTAQFYGSMGGKALDAPIVGIATTPDQGGYWLVASDGGVFAFGDAGFYRSMGGTPISAPIVGMAATPDGKGYWLVGRDGAVYAFGDARYAGGAAGPSPAVGIAGETASSYWIVLADGTVEALGGAAPMTTSHSPVAPTVGLVAGSGPGVTTASADGGVFALGGAAFAGSKGGQPLNAPVVGIASAVARV